MQPRRDLPNAFYYQLELTLTAERLWVELAGVHPTTGRAVWDSFGMLRPSGPLTELWVHHCMWSALMDLSERSESRR